MRATRKVTRELRQQARKTFKVALRDKIILDEYNKRFRDGFDVGYQQAQKEFRENPMLLYPSVVPVREEDK